MSIWGSPLFFAGAGNAYWRLRFYKRDGSVLKHTEYVVNGENSVYGVGEDWALSPKGIAAAGITENVRQNLDLYSTIIEIDFTVTVSGGYNGNALITVTANENTVFTAHSIGGSNYDYDTKSAQVEFEDGYADITVTPPSNVNSSSSPLIVAISYHGES